MSAFEYGHLPHVREVSAFECCRLPHVREVSAFVCCRLPHVSEAARSLQIHTTQSTEVHVLSKVLPYFRMIGSTKVPSYESTTYFRSTFVRSCGSTFESTVLSKVRKYFRKYVGLHVHVYSSATRTSFRGFEDRYFRTFVLSYLLYFVPSYESTFESTFVRKYCRTLCTVYATEVRKYFRTFVQFVLPEVRKYFRTSVLPCMCSFVCSKLLLSYLRTTVSYEGMSFRRKYTYLYFVLFYNS